MIDWSTVAWRKSTFCSSNSCVEVGLVDSQIVVRNSRESDGPVVRFTGAEWIAFLDGARRGEFDLIPSGTQFSQISVPPRP
jgi:Domain of unknown function (DUF397)